MKPALVDLSGADGADPPGATETHISVLFFAGSRVYKLCKPVDFGFLDYSTRAKREQACQREVRVNRRFAPDVYLGVLNLTDEDGQLVDHAVVMKRMPSDRSLASLLDGPDAPDLIRAVARRVATIHAEAPRPLRAADAATPAAIERNWSDNFESIRATSSTFVNRVDLEEAERLALQFLGGRAPLLQQRINAGHVIDGHGDLLSADIFCLEDGPRVLDALAFDERYRHGDVLADIAFLAMDLERRGHPDLAQQFVADYCRFSNEHHPESLAHHYIAYRACVRAKVAGLRAEQGDEAAAVEAAELLALCLHHLRAASPRLVIVGGAPATGKSTLASMIGDATGWTVLRSDEVRKEIFGLAPLTDATAAPGEGIYQAEHTAATYRQLLRRAERLASLGESVVLDASWLEVAWRDEARLTASRTMSDLVELQCVAPADVADARIALRRARGDDPSDATVDVARTMRASFADWPTAVTVDMTAPLETCAARALEVVGAGSGPKAPSLPACGPVGAMTGL